MSAARRIKGATLVCDVWQWRAHGTIQTFLLAWVIANPTLA